MKGLRLKVGDDFHWAGGFAAGVFFAHSGPCAAACQAKMHRGLFHRRCVTSQSLRECWIHHVYVSAKNSPGFTDKNMRAHRRFFRIKIVYWYTSFHKAVLLSFIVKRHFSYGIFTRLSRDVYETFTRHCFGSPSMLVHFSFGSGSAGCEAVSGKGRTSPRGDPKRRPVKVYCSLV